MLRIQLRFKSTSKLILINASSLNERINEPSLRSFLPPFENLINFMILTSARDGYFQDLQPGSKS